MQKTFELVFFLLIILFAFQLSFSQNACNLEIKWCEDDSTQIQKNSPKIKDSWWGWDKIGHLGFSAVLSGIFYQAYHQQFSNPHKNSVYFSASLTFSLGMGKEIYDSKKPKNKFSYKDLIFDMVGIATGIIIASQ